MNCRTSNRSLAAKRARAGFTLAEVLAAMLFLAIVIPVAVGALRIAGVAGEMSVRKAVAVRMADGLINEMVVTRQTQKSAQWGTLEERGVDYSWTMDLEPTGLEDMRLATVQVTYPVQGKDYHIRLSTLVDLTQ